MTQNSFQTWMRQIDDAIANSNGCFHSFHALSTVDSTQDEARRRGLVPGEILSCSLQTKGRGREGRQWVDGGLAVTFVVEPERSKRLAILGAIAAAESVQKILNTPVEIKWPNDIMVGGRKLAGILVEQTNDLAYVGIGINVGQDTWPQELASKAVSLKQLGTDMNRGDVLLQLIQQWSLAASQTDEDLCAAFAARDFLQGRNVTLLHSGEEFRGVLVEVNPMSNLVLASEGVERTFAAATTRILRFAGDEEDLASDTSSAC